MKRETFRLDEWTRRRVEADIEAGIYPNKSEAFRSILRDHYAGKEPRQHITAIPSGGGEPE